MKSKLQGAEAERTEFEERLRTELERVFGEVEAETPWAAAAIAYHHGLSFECVVGVLPESDWSSDPNSSPDDLLNPAEWCHYDDDGLYLEDDRVTELGRHLDGLGYEDADPPYAREIYLRIALALRSTLIESKRLSPLGIVVVTDYQQCDMRENLAKTNPVEALRRFRMA